MTKLDFLQTSYLDLLASLDEQTKPQFGKMNVQQMIEHMSYAFQQASGLIPIPNTQPEEVTARMYQFMMSDKPFRDNTPNIHLPENPLPAVHAAKDASLEALKKDIAVFVETFAQAPGKRIENPFFGQLNFEEWVHLLHKHAMHHLRQFNILPTA
jgi:hypothetical protein